MFTEDVKQQCNKSGRGWPGGAKELGKFTVPGRPTNLYDSRARA